MRVLKEEFEEFKQKIEVVLTQHAVVNNHLLERFMDLRQRIKKLEEQLNDK